MSVYNFVSKEAKQSQKGPSVVAKKEDIVREHRFYAPINDAITHYFEEPPASLLPGQTLRRDIQLENATYNLSARFNPGKHQEDARNYVWDVQVTSNQDLPLPQELEKILKNLDLSPVEFFQNKEGRYI